MKIKEGFQLRNICDTNVIVAQGLDNINFSKIISLNDSAAWLWSQVENKDFTVSDLAALLKERYEVSSEVAQEDAEALAKAWIEAEIVAE